MSLKTDQATFEKFEYNLVKKVLENKINPSFKEFKIYKLEDWSVFHDLKS